MRIKFLISSLYSFIFIFCLIFSFFKSVNSSKLLFFDFSFSPSIYFFANKSALSKIISFLCSKSGANLFAFSLNKSSSCKKSLKFIGVSLFFLIELIILSDNISKSLFNLSSKRPSFSLLKCFNSSFILFCNLFANSLLISSSIKLLLLNSSIYFLVKSLVKFFNLFPKSASSLFSSLNFLISFWNLLSKSSVFLMHSLVTTYFQVFSMTGIHPELIESKIFCTNSTSIEPLNNCFLKVLGTVIFNIFFLKFSACSKNSVLNSSLDIYSKFCKSFSFSTGLTIVKQSLSGK